MAAICLSSAKLNDVKNQTRIKMSPCYKFTRTKERVPFGLTKRATILMAFWSYLKQKIGPDSFIKSDEKYVIYSHTVAVFES